MLEPGDLIQIDPQWSLQDFCHDIIGLLRWMHIRIHCYTWLPTKTLGCRGLASNTVLMRAGWRGCGSCLEEDGGSGGKLEKEEG